MDGKEALKIIENAYQNGQKYKAIFTDLSMPEMDGI